MTTSRIDEAVLAIARTADDDLVLLQPPAERHLDPFTAVFAFAAMLAGSYMQGLLGSFRKDAEALGNRTGQGLKAALVRIFRGEQNPEAIDLEGLSTEVAAVIAADRVAAAEAADAARMHLVDALIENGLPADRALRLAATVQREAFRATTSD
jgi:hypothetical protein